MAQKRRDFIRNSLMTLAIALVPEVLRPVIPKVAITNYDAVYIACMRIWYEAVEAAMWYGVPPARPKDEFLYRGLYGNIAKHSDRIAEEKFLIYYKEALENT